MKATPAPDWKEIADELVVAVRSGNIPTLVNALHTYDAANGNEWSLRVKRGNGYYNYGEPKYSTIE